MPVIAVINRKGGSGKSTLATHLAAQCARQGRAVVLGDGDCQQSAQTWLRLRRAQHLPEHAPIVGWSVDPRHSLRPPAGIGRVVLDTPGGLQGFDLARLVMMTDAILMPVCNSMFDRASAAECYAELKALPRVASGRCRVAAIGMRLDARTRAAEVLQAWADSLALPFIGVLRETQAYVRCVEQGLTLFDMPAAQVQADMAQWQPILDWVELTWQKPAERPQTSKRPPAAQQPPLRVRTTATSTAPPSKPVAPAAAAKKSVARPAPAKSADKLFGWLALPRFLRRS